jgi:REP element-mobilizing transposase RayT
LFGEVTNGKMRLNRLGEIVHEEWFKTADMRANVELDAFVIMPNHIHGIIEIHADDRRGTLQRAPTKQRVPTKQHPHTIERFGKPTSNSIPTILRLFKSAVTKRINKMRGTPGLPVWQRNYYEHIIRNDDELARIREYIVDNPLKWELDRENPSAKSIDPAPEATWLK